MPPVTQDQAKNMNLKELSVALSPDVAAADLASPPQPVKVRPPKIAQPPNGLNEIVKNVRTENDNIISAQTEEAKQLAALRNERSQLGLDQSLADFSQQQQDRFGIPQSVRELKDINLQLSDLQTQSDLSQTAIAGADGQTLAQGQRELTQEDREFAVRSAGLAARAAILQGNIETANTLVQQAVNTAFQDRQLKSQNLRDQITDLSGVVDQQTAQLLAQKQRELDKEDERLAELKSAVSGAMMAGASQQEMNALTGSELTDEQKLALAQQIQARVAGEERDLQRQQVESSLQTDAAQRANIASQIGDREARLGLAQQQFQLDQQEAEAIAAAGNDPQKVQDTLNNLAFLRDTNARILGTGDFEGEGLYKKASQAPLRKGISNLFTGTTGEARLEAQVDTLRANMLTLATDPTIKEFFGPQMSDADVRLMTAAGTTLRPGDQTPEELKDEVQRIDDLINRMETSVRQQAQGNSFSGNVITAPDGTLIEIID